MGNKAPKTIPRNPVLDDYQEEITLWLRISGKTSLDDSGFVFISNAVKIFKPYVEYVTKYKFLYDQYLVLCQITGRPQEILYGSPNISELNEALRSTHEQRVNSELFNMYLKFYKEAGYHLNDICQKGIPIKILQKKVDELKSSITFNTPPPYASAPLAEQTEQ